MKPAFLSAILLGTVSASWAGPAPDGVTYLRTRTSELAYQRVAVDGRANLSVYNFTDGSNGFMVKLGEEVIGYSLDGIFDISTAPPAMVAMLEALTQSSASDNGDWTPVGPLANDRGYVMWNQDSPFNDLCPEYQLGMRAPSGCVATAMAQVMYYHRWPERGTGTHTYSPAVLYGNTLTADFGSTEYKWDAMVPYYAPGIYAPGYTEEESRAAVAELMLHCGVSVDMFYYTQSGATDYDVPPALVNYFGYDRSMAYRKREHYSTRDWLGIIHSELEAGRPVLAYGRSASGGHAYVFDGMDSDGFIHVNWGWGGMSNGYFNTSALTPPTQGIGGSDGGFNYSQRIITGVKPADAIQCDYHVEITSNETLSAGKKKIAQGGDVRIKLTGKVYNHGWRDSDFDYALILRDASGATLKVVEGQKGKSLAVGATDYAPDFGNVSLGVLDEGLYTLVPAVRMTGGSGEWIPMRDEYIGYPNILNVTADAESITFSSPEYFDLKASDTMVPDVIYSGIPALVTTNVTNEGDVEYHGEIRAVLLDGRTEVATTSNYIIDLAPGESTPIRFTDAFNANAGAYQIVLLNDDGQRVCAPVDATVVAAPELGDVSSAAKLQVVQAKRSNVTVKASVKSDGLFRGLLYAFIFKDNGGLQAGCLYPEYISLIDSMEPLEVTLSGEFENALPGESYVVQLATYDGSGYTFLNDEDSSAPLKIEGLSGVDDVEAEGKTAYRYYDFNGFEVDPKITKYYKKVIINKQ